MNVLVRGKPDAVLVVHDVITHAAVGGRTPASDQMLHVTLLKSGIGREIGVVGIVGGDRQRLMVEAMPLPASGKYGSVAVCGPYLAME